HEDTQITVASNSDHPRGSDVFGDVMVFEGFAGEIVLRDLSGGFDDVLLNGGGGAQDSAFFVNNADMHLGGNGDHVFAVYTTSAGNTSAIFDFDFTTVNASTGAPTVSRAVFLGSNPSVDGATVSYVNQGRVRQRAALPLPVDTIVNGGSVPPAGDLGADISGAVTICPNTEPRTAGGVVVWCQVNGSTPTLKRHLVSDGGTQTNNVTLSAALDVVRQGTLVGDQTLGSVQQPLVSATTIAWAEDDGGATGKALFTVDITGNPASTTVVHHTGFVSDSLADIDGSIVSSVQVRDITNDAIAVDTSAVAITSIGGTNDVSPQGDIAVDDGRVLFGDTSTGETLQLVDLSTLRWISGAPGLAVDTATSTQATAWIAAAGTRVGLAARLLPIETHPVVLLDTAANPVSFFGPAHADPTFAIGGTRVAWAVGTAAPFKIFVEDLTTGVLATVSVNGSVVMAIDPDGGDMVFVDGTGAVRDQVLPTPLPATLPASSVVALAGSGAPIFLDVDSGMIVAQRGGDPDRDQDISGAGQVVCHQGASNGIVVASGVRGPKVARLASGPFLMTVADNTGNGERAKGCFLTCSATPTCAPFNIGNVGHDSHVNVSRSGLIIYLNDFTTLNQVVSFDALSHRRRHLTSGDFERSSPTIASDRITFSDASLGGFDVFELRLP
ncbi:MAG TPA: hypothetical protein VGO62_21110, partial [Myxococcota bacterium]